MLRLAPITLHNSLLFTEGAALRFCRFVRWLNFVAAVLTVQHGGRAFSGWAWSHNTGVLASHDPPEASFGGASGRTCTPELEGPGSRGAQSPHPKEPPGRIWKGAHGKGGSQGKAE